MLPNTLFSVLSNDISSCSSHKLISLLKRQQVTGHCCCLHLQKVFPHHFTIRLLILLNSAYVYVYTLASCVQKVVIRLLYQLFCSDCLLDVYCIVEDHCHVVCVCNKWSNSQNFNFYHIYRWTWFYCIGHLQKKDAPNWEERTLVDTWLQHIICESLK